VLDLQCPGRCVLWDGTEVQCRIEAYRQESFESHRRCHPPGQEMLDADQVRGRLTCRKRRHGDFFAPLGCSGRQTVSDFLTNAKLPPDRREEVFCVCDELGIIYLAPLRIDQRVAVREGTRRVLRITLAPPGGRSGETP